jgi:excisionase family DNA binding protein
MPNQYKPRPLLTTKEVCDYLQMSKWGIYKWVKDGKLKIKADIGGGSGWRFSLEDVNEAANIEVEESPFE